MSVIVVVVVIGCIGLCVYFYNIVNRLLLNVISTLYQLSLAIGYAHYYYR